MTSHRRWYGVYYGCVPARVALKCTVIAQCCVFKTNVAFSLSLFLINIAIPFTQILTIFNAGESTTSRHGVIQTSVPATGETASTSSTSQTRTIGNSLTSLTFTEKSELKTSESSSTTRISVIENITTGEVSSIYEKTVVTDEITTSATATSDTHETKNATYWVTSDYITSDAGISSTIVATSDAETRATTEKSFATTHFLHFNCLMLACIITSVVKV